MASLTAQQIIKQLDLVPLEGEGGYYRRLYLDEHNVATAELGPFLSPILPLTSVIYYLMTPSSISSLHWLAGLEVWTWIAGDPVEQVLAFPSGEVEIRRLGIDDTAEPVSVVPGDCYQGSRLIKGGEHGYALCSTVMSPAFSQSDFRLATVAECEQFPRYTAYLKEFLAEEVM